MFAPCRAPFFRGLLRAVPLVLLSCVLRPSAGHAAVNATVADFVAYNPTPPSGDPMPYRLFKPDGFDPAAATRYPLIVFMHGAGEGYEKTWNGGDYQTHSDYNQKQLTGQTAPLVFVNATNRVKHPAFMVAPQICSKDGQPGRTWWSNPPTRIRLKALVDALVAEFPIDPDRIYVTGLSLGGMGSYAQVQNYPGFYAAAAPTDGEADITSDMIDRLVGFPLWVGHGALDTRVPPSKDNALVTTLRARGGNVIYSYYANVGHSAWNPFYAHSTNLTDWLMAQRRGQPPMNSGRYVQIVSPAGDIARATDRATLSGTAATLSTGLTISWYNTALTSGAGRSFDTRVAATGSSSWTAANIPLVPGQNRIVIVATDASEASFNDTVLITRLPDDPLNTAPIVTAGPDHVLRGQSSVELTGSFTDDGRPLTESPVATWTQVSGPAQGLFTDPGGLHTTVTLPAFGKYTFRLTVSDGQLSGADDCVVDRVPDESVWTAADIGATGATGSSSGTGTDLTLVGGGRMEGWLDDSLHFRHRALEGNLTLTFRLVSLDAGWVGAMIRRSTHPQDRFAMIGTTPTFVRGGHRTVVGADGNFPSAWGQRPWLRLRRHGDTFTGFYSANGSAWTQLFSQSIPMEGAVYAGFGIYSGNTTGTAANATLADAMITLDPPDPVTGLEAEAHVSLPRIQLAWSASAGATSYRIERAGPGDGPFAPIAQVAAPALGYLDEGLPPGVTYRYRVMAVTAPAREAVTPSTIVQATTAAAQPDSGIAAWRQAHFDTPENAGDAMDSADPDGDGLPNLLEYAIGTLPKEPTAATARPDLAIAEGATPDERRLVLTFTRRKSASDIHYVVEAAADLGGPWAQIDPFSPEHVATVIDDSPAPGLETRSVVDVEPLGPTARRFMRLRVSRAEP